VPQLDPEMSGYVERCLRFFDAEADSTDLDLQRRMYRDLCRAFARPRPEGLEVRDSSVPGVDGEVPLRVYRPAGLRAPPTVLFLHGGGWILGDLESHDDVAAEIAMRCRAGVVAVAYRLAPENPFPIPFDDCYAALTAVAEDPARFGLGAHPIVVAGDSAGGTLAAALALKARDRGGPALAGQALVYPGLGGDAALPSYREHGEAPLLTAADVEAYWRHYLGGRAPEPPEYARPLAAPDLSGLPPAYLQAAEIDPLRDDAAAYATRLNDAGVAAECVVEPGLVHGFLRARGSSQAAAAAFDRFCGAIQGFLAA